LGGLIYIIKYDVVVVGAGPAGSTAAKILAEKGIDVLLLDKEKFPRNKSCGGGLPLKVLKNFPYIHKTNAIESYSYGGYIFSQSLKYKIEVHKKNPVIAMVLRDKFDHYLVKLAEDEGAYFRDETKVKNIINSGDKISVFLKDGNEIKTKIVIGADGYLSLIVRKMGLCNFSDWIGTCICKEFEFIPDKNDFNIHLKFNNVSGYAWVFPKKKSVNIGIGHFYRMNSNIKRKKNLWDLYFSY